MSYPQEQFEYDELLMLWKQHARHGFPCLGDVDINKGDLVMLDLDLHQIVEAFVNHRKLRPRNIKVLHELQTELTSILPLFSGEAATYFNEWSELVRRTLGLVEMARVK